jgi:hypothetical protein
LIKRRKIMALLGGAAAGWPLTARAQQTGKIPTIGLLSSSSAALTRPRRVAFVQGMSSRRTPGRPII